MLRLQLKEVAEAQGLNISQTARLARLDVQVVRRYWHNKVDQISLETLDQLGLALKVDPKSLLIRDDEHGTIEDYPKVRASSRRPARSGARLYQRGATQSAAVTPTA